MARVAVLGTYDVDPQALARIDLMRYLAAVGHAPCAVVFRTGGAPRRSSPLNRPIETGGVTGVQVRGFNDLAAVEAMRALDADLFVYAGGRDLLTEEVLAASRLGCIGGHYGRLPEIRGMGTVEWSVILDRSIVVAVQRLSVGVDTGDVLIQVPVPLRRDDTFARIRERCYFTTKVLLAIAVRGLIAGTLGGDPQLPDHGRQYFRLHPAMLELAERKLARRLAAYPPR